ncbi:MAG: Gfo/Idh/MocA family oxidoreductase [Bauldia sp.]|nr:Gfo/Idh/MocA family oxidoreductase [Bauldia sp.]
MPGQVRVAIVGAGRMAEEHARVYAALPDAALVGIHSRSRDRAEALAARHGIPAVFDSVADLAAGTGADLVLIAVNELSMLAIIREAARFPWTLFLEKPPGYTLAVAEAIGETVRAAERVAYVGLNRRYYAASLAAEAALAAGSGPRYIVVNDQQSYAEARSHGHPEEVVRHFMYANSIHLVDYLRLFGRGAVTAVERDGVWRGEETFLLAADVTFESGDRGRYEALWQAPGPWAVSIATREQRLEMRPLESLAIQRAGTRRAEAQALDPIDQTYKAGFYRQAEDMIRAMRGAAHRMPTLDAAMETMRLIHAIYGV